MSWESWDYPPYVTVAERKKKAARKVTLLKKKGQDVCPIIVEGRAIAKTFWGKAWCKHLETYSDYETRLPRGRAYVRHGSVIDLKLKPGRIQALVSGSSLYTVDIEVDPLDSLKWEAIIKECSGKIESLIELLQGKFSKGVMEIITRPERGLFPDPKEIKLSCSCYDWAETCKHVTAVLYGIGARLDDCPEDLFVLRGVNHQDLLTEAGTYSFSEASQQTKTITGDLAALFGINIEEEAKKDGEEGKHKNKEKRSKRAKISKTQPPFHVKNKTKP